VATVTGGRFALLLKASSALKVQSVVEAFRDRLTAETRKRRRGLQDHPLFRLIAASTSASASTSGSTAASTSASTSASTTAPTLTSASSSIPRHQADSLLSHTQTTQLVDAEVLSERADGTIDFH
jgi:hypothetical protein